MPPATSRAATAAAGPLEEPPGSARCPRGCGPGRRRSCCRCCWRRPRACCRPRRSPLRRRGGRRNGPDSPGSVGVSISALPKRWARQGRGHSSLITTGTPCNGPAGAASSISLERSGKVSTTALIAGLRSSIRARQSSSSSPASSSPEPTASACSRRDRSSPLNWIAPRSVVGPGKGRGRARARSRPGRGESRSRIAWPKSWCAAPITARSVSSALEPERGEAAVDEIVCRVGGLHSDGNPTEARWPGSCNRAGRGHSLGGEGRIPAATPVEHRGCRFVPWYRQPKIDPPGRARQSPPRSPACSSGWPSPSGREAPTRLPPASSSSARPRKHRPHLPGQDRQRGRGHTLPGRGARDRLPGDGRRCGRPLRGSLRRQDRRLVDNPGASVSKMTKTTSDEITYFDEFLGSPSEARIGVLRPIEESKPPKYTLVRQSPLQILNPYFGGKVIFALEHPLTVLQGADRRPHGADLGADVRLQRHRRKHLARQPPARTLLQPRRHPGRPPPTGRRQDQDLRMLLLKRAIVVYGDSCQGALTGAYRRPRSLACRARHAPCVLELLGQDALLR